MTINLNSKARFIAIKHLFYLSFLTYTYICICVFVPKWLEDFVKAFEKIQNY